MKETIRKEKSIRKYDMTKLDNSTLEKVRTHVNILCFAEKVTIVKMSGLVFCGFDPQMNRKFHQHE